MSPGLRIKKLEQPLCMKQRGCLNIRNCFLRMREKIVRHTYYTLSFNSRHKQANWVYYILGSEGKERVAERTDRFREDKKVPSGSAKPSDYTKSGYDRGHLCPAADMTHSAEAMEETFLMSNISPQLPVFNRGIWKSLEKQVRDWGEKERIYIVTGPVFKDNKGKIGRTGVTVPGFFLQSSLCSRGPANDCFCSSQYPRKKAIAGLCSDCGFRRTAHKHRFFPTIIRYT